MSVEPGGPDLDIAAFANAGKLLTAEQVRESYNFV